MSYHRFFSLLIVFISFSTGHAAYADNAATAGNGFQVRPAPGTAMKTASQETGRDTHMPVYRAPAEKPALGVVKLGTLTVMPVQANIPDPGPTIATQGQAAARSIVQSGVATMGDKAGRILSKVRVMPPAQAPTTVARQGCPAQDVLAHSDTGSPSAC